MNLNFSSIEEKNRKDVIENCYVPLLDLAETSKIKIAIEASGYTLLEIKKIAPEVLVRFKHLIERRKIEFIGCGYVQLISAIAPYEVNCKNIEIGIQIYQNLLGLVPKYMLVNEMAYSRSIVDIMLEYKFQGILVERNNVEYAFKDKTGSSNDILNMISLKALQKNPK